MIIPNGFTHMASKAIMQSQIFAASMGLSTVGTGHLLVGLMRAGDDATKALMDSVDLKTMEAMVLRCYGRGDVGYARVKEMSPHLQRVVLRAAAYSVQSEHRMFAGTAHIWQELLLEEGCHAHEILHALGLEVTVLQSRMNSLFGNIQRPEAAESLPPSDAPVTEVEAAAVKRESQQRQENMNRPLSRYARNLTQEAREMRLEPMVGRQSEINSLIQILGKKSKNNPLLVGEPGVGKTAVVEGFAQRIVQGDVPQSMRNLKVYALDLTRLMAGTRFRGDYEDRISKVIEDVESDPNTILFIDEIHMLIGSGAAEGSMDTANMMKPVLARGGFRVIGATTHKEYRKYFEKDMALVRRFQTIEINEPNRQETLDILFGIRDRYEDFHHVSISDQALVAAVDFSSRYITDRSMPDKAIDLIDETASMRKLHLQENKMDHVENTAQLLRAIADGDNQMQSELTRRRVEDISNPVVIPEDVAKVVCSWTGIPIDHILHSGNERLADLEGTLAERVVGQDAAIHTIVSSLRRSVTGLGEPNRPLGVFMMLGTSGVGKTELCRALAEQYFGSEDALIRLDMSEYAEEISLTSLIGSPPGYVGYGNGAKLTDSVLNRPYSVVLFDEIEKAHPKVYNLLLQLIDNGQLTDSVGRRINFRNTIVMMTSNAGISFDMEKQMGFGETSVHDIKKQVLNRAKNFFRPEFLGRIDEIVVMNSLTPADGAKIARIMLGHIEARLAARGIQLSYTEDVPDLIAQRGMDKMSGARNIHRTIMDMVETPLSERLLTEPQNQLALLTVEDEEIVIRLEPMAGLSEPQRLPIDSEVNNES